MNSKKNGYTSIFKTTFLFGFVQIARLLISVIKNKVVAIVLGPQGVGIISIFNNAIDLIKTGAGLGVSQSAVKDISEAKASGNIIVFSETINVVKKVVYFTSILGLLITVVLSPILSMYGFGSYKYTWAYVFLSIAVFFSIFLENQLSILKGMRLMKVLAKTSLVGSIIGVMIGLPSIFILKEKGIVISIIVSAIGTSIYTSFHVAKISYQKISLSLREVYLRALPMMGMGISLMAANFFTFFSNMVILGYIQRVGGLSDVGFFHAGSVLVISYFSMVTTAMNTDFYPRISECANDNKKIEEEIYSQSIVGLTIIQPLITTFILLSPLMISLLYSNEFSIVKNYIDTAIFGIVISIISNCYGYLIIVKRAAKFYFVVSLIFAILLIPLYMFFYKYFSLRGLGFAYTINVIAQFFVYYIYCYRNYHIKINKNVVIDLVFSLLLIIFSMYIRELSHPYLRYGCGAFIVLGVILFAIWKLNKYMNLNFLKFVQKSLKR